MSSTTLLTLNPSIPIPTATIVQPSTSKILISNNEWDERYFRELEKSGIHLNAKQIEAVRSTQGPVLTLAGAGSGKTAVLTARAGYLLAVKKVKPQHILIVTFTKKAALELQERLRHIPGVKNQQANEILSGTFHSIFLRLLRSIGFKQKILSNDKQIQIIIKNISKELGITNRYEPDTLLANFSYMSNHLIFPQTEKTNSLIDASIQEAYKAYAKYKENNDYMDFDDILIFTYRLLNDKPTILKNLQSKFKYIEVDEYQDTSVLQHEIVKLLALPQNNLFIVGDDSQSIYQFRAASPDIILNFTSEFTEAKKIILDINYRSNQYIVGLGNEIIKRNKKRYEKTLHSIKTNGLPPTYSHYQNVQQEAAAIVAAILKGVHSITNRKWGDYAILYRTHTSSRAITDELVQKKIPFVKYGKETLFYENSIVKPVVDYLRLSLNPNDLEAIKSISQTMYLKKELVSDYLIQQTNSLNNTPSLLALLTYYPGIKSKEQINIKLQMIQQLNGLSPMQAIREIRFGIGRYQDYLAGNKESSSTSYKEMINELLNELEESSKSFETLEEYIHFVDEVILKHKVMDELKKEENPDAVKLMTIHGAKGLEFPVVFLINICESVLPHKSALKEFDDRISLLKGIEKVQEATEEERRLMYVAVTRAKEELNISWPLEYRSQSVQLSRFLLEVFNKLY